MGQILVRNINDDLKRRLRERAENNGVSMEEEVRTIIQNSLLRDRQSKRNLASEIEALFTGIGIAGEPLEPLPQSSARAVDFTE